MARRIPSEDLFEVVGPDREALSPDVFIAESNHRIANNLTLISGVLRLQAAEIARAGRPMSSRDVCALLEDAGERLQTVARLHGMLADARARGVIDLGDYLSDIAQAAVGSASMDGRMRLAKPEFEPCPMPSSHALSVGFIVGELITNALKYAHPAGLTGQIALGCRRECGRAIVIEVADDGVGLPEDFDPGRHGGMGMRLMRTLTAQLGAILSFESTALGLRASLRLPSHLAAPALMT